MIHFGGYFDLEGKGSRLKELEDEISGNPDFWNDSELSTKVLKEKKTLEDAIKEAKSIRTLADDIEAGIELSEEAEVFEETVNCLESFKQKVADLEVASLLSDPLDHNSSLLTINAGAGGTESCDWASMLLRMYIRFAESKGWDVTFHDMQEGDEAGIKSATFEITGDKVYGLLKGESGVHRLVRISPFDSNARRHTSFASVYLSAVIDDAIEVTIDPSDLRIDTYRASGAGGQHVNRTDSAVRITHNPSGVVVQCQSQRSQHQNKDTAMKMLRSKLYELELEKRRQEQSDLESQKSEIGFGSQIRSYVLHPYKMVKDHRTNLESHSPNKVLDGELSDFISSYLFHSRK